ASSATSARSTPAARWPTRSRGCGPSSARGWSACAWPPPCERCSTRCSPPPLPLSGRVPHEARHLRPHGQLLMGERPRLALARAHLRAGGAAAPRRVLREGAALLCPAPGPPGAASRRRAAPLPHVGGGAAARAPGALGRGRRHGDVLLPGWSGRLAGGARLA